MQKKSYYDLFVINKVNCINNNFENIKQNVFTLINFIILNKGVVLKIEFCGKKKFFYKINNEYEGYYIILYFYIYRFNLCRIFKFLKKNINFLRFLIINTNVKNNYITNNFK